jgi:RHS repeat-associated protein
MSWTRSNPTQDVFGYPLYDAHGNMVRTLSRTSSGGYAVSAETVVDPWGTKLSSGTGEKRVYCASIGHVTDDESGLVYMRARYYEPGMGRFVSEDPAMDGSNWYGYCRNDPVDLVDVSGRHAAFWALGLMFSGATLTALGALFDPTVGGYAGPSIAMTVLTVFYAIWAFESSLPSWLTFSSPLLMGISTGLQSAREFTAAMEAAADAGKAANAASVARTTLYFYIGYSLLLITMMVADLHSAL